jgi:hypothetical protein
VKVPGKGDSRDKGMEASCEEKRDEDEVWRWRLVKNRRNMRAIYNNG